MLEPCSPWWLFLLGSALPLMGIGYLVGYTRGYCRGLAAACLPPRGGSDDTRP